MNKKDIAELKKRMTKKGVTFTRLRGCYVNSEKEIILNINENFLNMDEEDMFKYMDIAKRTLSGKLGNNLLELEFPIKEESDMGKQQFLMGLKSSALKNDDLLERFFELIIENYDYPGNYLILLYHDAYDVMTKTTDNNKLDESEEVYEYILCAICPVILSKPGLGYRQDENRIGSRIRDWVVDVPNSGFIFPAFTDRSTDIHSIMFYTKDTKEPHNELVEGAFGCNPRKTGTEQKNIFRDIVMSSVSADEDESTDVLLDIQENLSYYIEECVAAEADANEPIILTNEKLVSIMEDAGVEKEVADVIENSYKEEFQDILPVAEFLIDNKAINDNIQKKRERGLVKEVCELKQQIEEMAIKEDDLDGDVVLKVKPQKVELIKTQMIDGKKYIMIPMDEDDEILINGKNKKDF